MTCIIELKQGMYSVLCYTNIILYKYYPILHYLILILFYTNIFIYIYKYCHIQKIATDADHEWTLCFDGSADRCKMPVAMTVIASPKPLILKVDDHEGLYIMLSHTCKTHTKHTNQA